MTKKSSKNYISFVISVLITVAIGYGLSLGATAVYNGGLNKVHLPLGDSSLLLGGLYFLIVLIAGAVITYLYERFELN
jgi:putative flippase GtrA